VTSLFRNGLVLAALVTGVLSPALVRADTAGATTISVVASNWKFTPAVITVHVGKPTTLKLSAAVGAHGLASPDLGIPQTVIVQGTPTSVTFTPTKTGTYVLHCAIPCGSGHDHMVLTVKVVA